MAWESLLFRQVDSVSATIAIRGCEVGTPVSMRIVRYVDGVQVQVFGAQDMLEAATTANTAFSPLAGGGVVLSATGIAFVNVGDGIAAFVGCLSGGNPVVAVARRISITRAR